MPIDVKKDSLETALQKLKARENSFHLLEKINNFGSWEVDLVTHKSIWSKNSYHIYEIEPFSIEPTLEVFFSHLVPEDVERAKKAMDNVIKSHKVQTFKCTFILDSGNKKNLMLNAQAVYDKDGTPLKLVGTTHDITQRERLEKQSKELISIIENSSSEIYIVDEKSSKYLYVNRAACDALGYSKDELLNGLGVLDINKELTEEKIKALHKKYSSSSKSFITNQTIHTRKDGTTYHVQSHIQKMIYDSKEAYVIFDTDVTQNILVNEVVEKQSELLIHQANYDTLTNLPNRAKFQKQLAEAITIARKQNSKFSLFFIDLDHFKNINDSLGHHVGDLVLQEAANRLKRCLRDKDSIARLGGDEFTVILHNTKKVEDIITVADKIINVMKEPITISSNTLYITSSIGIAIYPEHGSDKNSLLKYADTAMYTAKKAGRNNYQLYSTEMSKDTYKKVVMENSLRIAISKKQFEPYYQPQIDIVNNKITGMEALVRWKHETLGIVSPADFIPLAEELGLIIDIDRIVMEKTMQQFSTWYKEGLNPGKLSLNLSMQHLQKNDFILNLFKTAEKFSFKKEWLDLEVTETQVMNNPDIAIKKLQEISDNNIEISIDDFGTGYSSLAYLKKLPLNKLKIDKSFIDDIPEDEDDIAITRAIIALADSLNLDIIAEGVETKEQKEFLLKNNCHAIQGYIYSKPLPAQEMVEYLKNFKKI